MWLWNGVIVAVGLVCLIAAHLCLVEPELGEWRGRRRSARRACASCLCCRGYPVCWVAAGAPDGLFEYGAPVERLCNGHLLRWLHIRQLERECLGADPLGIP